MTSIGKYLTLEQASKSDTALRKGIDNSVPAAIIPNLERLCKELYDPLCDKLGFTVPFNSMYRSVALNKAIGGSATSVHCKGCAVDLDMDGSGSKMVNKELFNFIRSNFDFDQLIWEFGSDDHPDWVHVGISPTGTNRKQVLRGRKDSNGKTYYEPC